MDENTRALIAVGTWKAACYPPSTVEMADLFGLDKKLAAQAYLADGGLWLDVYDGTLDLSDYLAIANRRLTELQSPPSCEHHDQVIVYPDGIEVSCWVYRDGVLRCRHDDCAASVRYLPPSSVDYVVRVDKRQRYGMRSCDC